MRNLLWLIGAVSLGLSAPVMAADVPAPKAEAVLIAPPAPDVVRTRVTDWVASRNIREPQILEQIARLWTLTGTQPLPEELLDQTVRTFALADPESAKLVAGCTHTQGSLLPPDPAPLAKADTTPFYRSNLGLFYGRYLAQRQMYDEALEVLVAISPADVVDPASLLFFKGVCQHRLLQKKEGLATLEQLLKNTEKVPLRYSTLATLMQYDLESLHEKTLDEISRKMSDVERRLSLGRTGQKVQKKEDEIVATLDDLIKKIEEQQGGGGGGGGSDSKGKSNKNNKSSSPAQDSSVKGETAPGATDKKNLKNEGGWGALPPKARAKAREDIARKFPAHYKNAIEEFTRKQASRTAPNK